MTRQLAALPFALLLAACTGAGAVTPEPAQAAHGHASSAQPLLLPSPMMVPLDAATLAALPRQSARGSAHGQALDCEGVALVDLLRATGAMPAEPLRGAQLTGYVRVEARDGYRALFSLAELDPTLGGGTVYLVDRCNGVALGDDSGPLRLLAPGEARPARWVRQVDAITVIVAP